MIKLEIPKQKPEDKQEYVIIEETQVGPRKTKTLRLVTKEMLLSDKAKIESEIAEKQDKIKSINDSLKGM